MFLANCMYIYIFTLLLGETGLPLKQCFKAVRINQYGKVAGQTDTQSKEELASSGSVPVLHVQKRRVPAPS